MKRSDKRVWDVWFQKDGGEGHMYITSRHVERVDNVTILADGVQITMQEPIEGMEVIEEELL